MAAGNTVGEKAKKKFAEYLSTKKILVADVNAGSRAGLAKIIISLGGKTQNTLLASSFAIAEQMIKDHKPHVVICDYDLGKQCGLELLQSQRSGQPESKDCLFILVTGNTSQSAVAQSAEEDVDTFILKPYTIDTLRATVTKAATAKLFPDPYMKTIEEGKKILFEGKAKEAIEIFKTAMTMNTKPALAYFYHGQAQLMQEAIEAAEKDYSEGLNVNKIHYKCLIGLFDLLMKRKQLDDAYDLIKRVSRYFPANPQRLTQVLRLAIATKNYEDIERYYQIFTNIETRNDELIKYICAALVVCGKHYLIADFSSRAFELFQKAAVTAAGRTRILREIIQLLIEFKFAKEAKAYLQRFPAETHLENDFQAMLYLVNNEFNDSLMTISQGRELLSRKVYDPMIYKVLIKRSYEKGYTDNAEDLIVDASKHWPDLQAEFQKLKPTAKAA